MEWWSWVLSGVGFAVMAITGRHRIGWLLGIGWEGLYAVYAIQTRQSGFLVSAFVYAVIFAVNYRRAGRRRPA